MDKFAENISYNHGISVNERKLIYITGVNKIESFDEEEFLLDTSMGYLAIKGNGLEIVRLDTKEKKGQRVLCLINFLNDT